MGIHRLLAERITSSSSGNMLRFLTLAAALALAAGMGMDEKKIMKDMMVFNSMTACWGKGNMYLYKLALLEATEQCTQQDHHNLLKPANPILSLLNQDAETLWQHVEVSYTRRRPGPGRRHGHGREEDHEGHDGVQLDDRVLGQGQHVPVQARPAGGHRAVHPAGPPQPPEARQPHPQPPEPGRRDPPLPAEQQPGREQQPLPLLLQLQQPLQELQLAAQPERLEQPLGQQPQQEAA